MELGEKLRAVRMEKGMTQKQLSEGIVTRNMLSQIENGIAKPSMKTLEAFAARLGKSISFFLEETAVISGNTAAMEQARKSFDTGDFSGALEHLRGFSGADPVYDREKSLMEQLCLLELSREAIRAGKLPYARELLEQCRTEGCYCREALNRQKLLLLGRLPGNAVSRELPSLDEELQLRGEEALREGKPLRAAALLDACQEQTGNRWLYLRGRCHLTQKNYAQATICLQMAEEAYPREIPPLLEICFREMGDYRQAYLYACKQR